MLQIQLIQNQTKMGFSLSTSGNKFFVRLNMNLKNGFQGIWWEKKWIFLLGRSLSTWIYLLISFNQFFQQGCWSVLFHLVQIFHSICIPIAVQLHSTKFKKQLQLQVWIHSAGWMLHISFNIVLFIFIMACEQYASICSCTVEIVNSDKQFHFDQIN